MGGWRGSYRQWLAVATLSWAVGGCASRPGSQPPSNQPAPSAPNTSPGVRRVPVQPDEIALYRKMGLLAEAGETPFVGTLSFFAGPSDDSTLIVLTVSLANRVLHWQREGDRYRAGYQVLLDIRRGTQVVRDVDRKIAICCHRRRGFAPRRTRATADAAQHAAIVHRAGARSDLECPERTLQP